jgi:tetratricopeptide (TPR) repeat protein
VEVVKIPRVLNREIVLLVALSLAAFGVFAFTRHMAARVQQLDAKIAAVWFERGMQYMEAGETEKAIQSFRKATADAGDNQKYLLALADALAADNYAAEAGQLLLTLRESHPVNAEINTQLARLAAQQGEVQEAVHYYQSALYSNWAAAQADERRRLRIEFIRFLLAHQQRDLATSELLVLQGRTPDSAPAHIETAKLFLEADDQKHALQEYEEAVRLDSHNEEALTGAGETSFQLGDYAEAERYLRDALDVNPDSQKARQLLWLAELVQSEDPLAPRLSPLERQRRLRADFQRSEQRLDSCLNQTAGSIASTELQALKAEALAVQPKLRSEMHPPDSDAVRSGVDLIFRMQQAASGHCGEPAPEDEALLLIGRRHNGERP